VQLVVCPEVLDLHHNVEMDKTEMIHILDHLQHQMVSLQMAVVEEEQKVVLTH
tara:strand:+ start:177 stop:335 length:159 start_codon:yes stop_codon:yes gene_type:complete